MTAYRAIAATDIRPGMTVCLKPGTKPFKVSKVEPWETRAGCVDLWGPDDKPMPWAGPHHFYAEVVGS